MDHTYFFKPSLGILAIILAVLFLISQLQNESEESFNPSDYEIALALAQAYPAKVTAIRTDQNRIGVKVSDKWLYLINRRILTEDDYDNWQQFRSNAIYYYPNNLPVLTPPSADMDKFISERENKVRSPVFFDMIYDGESYNQIVPFLEEVLFMGHWVKIHRRLVAPLRRIERTLKDMSKDSPEISLFFDSLSSVSGFYWRDMASSQSKSFHSYGAAIDLLPESYMNKYSYWLWVKDLDPNWYTTPYSKRWLISDKIVKVFEENGFIWGGKWRYYDNMHFEYRPDLLSLSENSRNKVRF